MTCEIRTVTFIDPDNTEQELPYSRGTTGFFGPPIEIGTLNAPGLSGAVLTDVRHGIREVAIPVYWKDLDQNTQLSTLRHYMFLLDPLRGDGTLRVDNPDGTSRQTTVRLNDGWNLEEMFMQFNEAILTFQVMGEPYWQDANDISATYGPNESEGTFFPFFPLSLGASDIFAEFVLDNNGDVATWPIFVLEGPLLNISVSNLTTGKELILSTELDEGQTLTIDTRPGHKSITVDPGDVNVFADLTPDSSLFNLPRGINTIRMQANGATSASSITPRYRRQWLSA